MPMSLPIILSLFLLASVGVAIALAVACVRTRDQKQSLLMHLQASESQYRQLLGVADLAIAILDEACHVVDWNPVLEKMYGRSREEMLGRQFFLCCAPEHDAAALSARMMAMRNSDAVLEFSFAVPTIKDGEREMRWRARHFTDVRDGRRYLSLVGHDVTDVESMQRWLQDSESRFRLMFEAVPAALALLDTEGRLLMANPACARFFGYDAPEQMVMLDMQELVHEDDRQASMNAMATLQQQPDGHYQMEKRYVRRNGDVRWGNMRTRLLTLGPEQTFLLAKISDVHERKQTELALLESERQMASLIANLPGAIYRYELTANRQGIHHDLPAEFLSDGADLLAGQGQGLFSSGDHPRSLGSLIVPEDRAAVQAALEAAMAGSGRFNVVFRLRHGPSGLRWMSESGRVWQRPDSSWTVDGHITDISAERHARDAEEAFRALVDEAQAGYVSLHPDGRVLEANPPFCAMAGVAAPEQLLGRVLESFMPAGREDSLRRFMARAMNDGVLRDVEFIFPRADGVELTLLVNAVAVEQDGQMSIRCLLLDMGRLIGILPDASERTSRERYVTQDGIA